MRRVAAVFIGMMVLISPTIAWTQEEHQHQHSHEASMPKEETLTGEVMDVFCYLSHKEQGQGKDHASCAKKCIQSGLPVAIKVGNQLYLATMADHEPANVKLAQYAGQVVTVQGKVMKQDGQHLIAITDIKKAQ